MAVYSTIAMALPWRAAVALWSFAALLPGCAGSHEWIYQKPRVTPAQLDHDKTVCRKAAPSRSMLRTLQEEKVEREGFNRCMEKLGYTITVVPRP
jgi:hypothetical protein